VRMDRITMTSSVIPCSCGGSYSVGEQDDKTPVLMHSIPACSAFIELDPGSYLQAERLKRSN